MNETDAKLDPTAENRREQLRKWIKHFFNGSQSAFGASTASANHGDRQINQGELSSLLKRKSFGEKRARSLELQAQMPVGYLDSISSPDAAALTPFLQMQPSLRADEKTFSQSIAWPFKLVSYERLQALRTTLGPRAANEAMTDMDKQLHIVLSKWEGEVKPAKKRIAGR